MRRHSFRRRSVLLHRNLVPHKSLASHASLASLSCDERIHTPFSNCSHLSSSRKKMTSVARRSHSPAVHAAPASSPPVAASRLTPQMIDSLAASETVRVALRDLVDRHRATPASRDRILRFVQETFLSHTMNPVLLHVLHEIEQVEPMHAPTLLLLACAYFAHHRYDVSAYYSHQLLSVDPRNVEALSNLGTVNRMRGDVAAARTWYWRAIVASPAAFDAIEGLLLLAENNRESLTIGSFVQSQLFLPTQPSHTVPDSLASFIHPSSLISRPVAIPPCVPSTHVHRLLSLLYGHGSLLLAGGDSNGARAEFEKVVECALCTAPTAEAAPANLIAPAPEPSTVFFSAGYTTQDLLIATATALRIITLASTPGAHTKLVLGFTIRTQDDLSGFLCQLFPLVHAEGERFLCRLSPEQTATFPIILADMEALKRLKTILFVNFRNEPPCLLNTHPGSLAASQTLNVLATTLVSLAKILQDSNTNNVTLTNDKKTGSLPSTTGLILAMYYLSLALHPSPSACNNLGILLTTINASTTRMVRNPHNGKILSETLSAQHLALEYYQYGITLDSTHPHLYTNIGSLLKDMGDTRKAIEMYRKAVDLNPGFDVALANLANATKDAGYIKESIVYYREAYKQNPKFSEALSGMVNALGGICDWKGRGGIGPRDLYVDDAGIPSLAQGRVAGGYLGKLSELVKSQLKEGRSYGRGVLAMKTPTDWATFVLFCLYGADTSTDARYREFLTERKRLWIAKFTKMLTHPDSVNEGGYLLRLTQWLMRASQRRWYMDTYGPTPLAKTPQPRIQMPIAGSDAFHAVVQNYGRITVPPTLPHVPIPTVLPFHTFMYPIPAHDIRLISHRTGLKVSYATLTQPWMPPHVFPPPAPPATRIKVGYISSDLGNHPLSHLMQSVFGMHNHNEFDVYVYATSPSDHSMYRRKIEAEAPHFLDVSSYSTEQIVHRIVGDGIHILINLSGYTKGARNEVFAARPAPVQMSYMGFAGTLAIEWCEYFIADPIVCPPGLVGPNQWRIKRARGPREVFENETSSSFDGQLDPEMDSDEFVYTEKIIYMPHSYFVTDHKQACRDPNSDNARSPAEQWTLEQIARTQMRRALFPNLEDDIFIFCNWNQLYKIDPYIFKQWLVILKQCPRSVLWLLRFPAAGEENLKEIATRWAGKDVASRIFFTDVTNKFDHISRGRVADLFLDTTECNAHTTAADILWSGTPLITFPRYSYKFSSRVATSIAMATGAGDRMVCKSIEEYVARAIEFYNTQRFTLESYGNSNSQTYKNGSGPLNDLRRHLFLTRDKSPLYDTQRWVKNLEKGLKFAWADYVSGKDSEESQYYTHEGEKVLKEKQACMWLGDDTDGTNLATRTPYFTTYES